MKFKQLDETMRQFETSTDYNVLPGIYMVARIDGRCFTRLTKKTHQFEAPYDIRFRELMVGTVKHLMNCGFKVSYGYTQSDEISLLLDPSECLFQRKERKINSILAGEASAKFSLLLNDVGAFDCRLSLLPSKARVIDYFRWRSEDAVRNALNAHCYWLLRKAGVSANEAAAQLSGASVAVKNELLFAQGINFNHVPDWQKRGVGLYWQSVEKKAFNPINNRPVSAMRRHLKVDLSLPMKSGYSALLEGLVPDMS